MRKLETLTFALGVLWVVSHLHRVVLVMQPVRPAERASMPLLHLHRVTSVLQVAQMKTQMQPQNAQRVQLARMRAVARQSAENASLGRLTLMQHRRRHVQHAWRDSTGSQRLLTPSARVYSVHLAAPTRTIRVPLPVRLAW